MSTPAAKIARYAAEHLIDLDPTLPEHVARLLLAGAGDQPPQRPLEFGTTLALAGFVLQVAQVGWQLSQALGKGELPAEALAQRIRAEMVKSEPPPDLTPEQFNTVIDTVAQEITTAGDRPAA